MHVSSSQISLADDCWRKWAWAYIAGLKIQNPAQIVGVNIHKKIQNYIEKNELPNENEIIKPSANSREFSVGKIALNALENLPNHDDIIGVEDEFSFKYQNVKYVGIIDLIFSSRTNLNILDHKTSSNPLKYGKNSSDLANDYQAIIYCYYIFQKYNWLDEIEFSLNYIDTFHNRNAGFLVVKLFDRKQIENKMSKLVDPIAQRIVRYKKEKIEPKKLAPNPNSCYKFGGCPYRMQCNLTLAEMVRATNQR